MDNLESYEKSNFENLSELFTSLNSLLDLLVEIFYKLQLDQATVEIKETDKKEYKKNINGPTMNVHAQNQQYLMQTYWQLGFV